MHHSQVFPQQPKKIYAFCPAAKSFPGNGEEIVTLPICFLGSLLSLPCPKPTGADFSGWRAPALKRSGAYFPGCLPPSSQAPMFQAAWPKTYKRLFSRLPGPKLTSAYFPSCRAPSLQRLFSRLTCPSPSTMTPFTRLTACRAPFRSTWDKTVRNHPWSNFPKAQFLKTFYQTRCSRGCSINSLVIDSLIHSFILFL